MANVVQTTAAPQKTLDQRVDVEQPACSPRAGITTEPGDTVSSWKMTSAGNMNGNGGVAYDQGTLFRGCGLQGRRPVKPVATVTKVSLVEVLGGRRYPSATGRRARQMPVFSAGSPLKAAGCHGFHRASGTATFIFGQHAMATQCRRYAGRRHLRTGPAVLPLHSSRRPDLVKASLRRGDRQWWSVRSGRRGMDERTKQQAETWTKIRRMTLDKARPFSTRPRPASDNIVGGSPNGIPAEYIDYARSMSADIAAPRWPASPPRPASRR